MPWDPAAVFSPSPDVSFRNTTPALVMAFDKRRGVMYELNDTASSVLKLIDGRRSVAAVIAALTEEYDADEQTLAPDVQDVLERLAHMGVIVPAAQPDADSKEAPHVAGA